MSKVGDYTQEFLDKVGYRLGYDDRNLPEFKDIDMVWDNRVPIWDYLGLTEAECYGVDENEGKTMP